MFWELLPLCWQNCANRWNNSQQRWDLQCIMERIQSTRFWRPSGMHVCGLKEVGRAVQKVLNLWPYTLAITEQKKCWELLAQKYDQFNLLSPNINIQILQTDPHTFPLRISWDTLIKDQSIFSLVIIIIVNSYYIIS